MPVLDRIEAQQCREQADFGLGHARSGQSFAVRKSPSSHYSVSKTCLAGLGIGVLCRGETRMVDAVVLVGIDAIVQRIDFRVQAFRVMIASRHTDPEGRVERADDLAGLVRNPCQSIVSGPEHEFCDLVYRRLVSVAAEAQSHGHHGEEGEHLICCAWVFGRAEGCATI